jgi:hypothetical protein
MPSSIGERFLGQSGVRNVAEKQDRIEDDDPPEVCHADAGDAAFLELGIAGGALRRTDGGAARAAVDADAALLGRGRRRANQV